MLPRRDQTSSQDWRFAGRGRTSASRDDAQGGRGVGRARGGPYVEGAGGGYEVRGPGHGPALWARRGRSRGGYGDPCEESHSRARGRWGRGRGGRAQRGRAEHDLAEQISLLDIGSQVPPLVTLPPSESDYQPTIGSDTAISTVTSKSSFLPPKPASGVIGNKVRVVANHFRVKFNLGSICQYDVEIAPRVSSKAVARAVIQELVSVCRSELGGKCPAYDGRNSMYTYGAFAFDEREFIVSLREEYEGSTRDSGREKKFTVTIRRVAIFNTSSLVEFLRGKPMSLPQELLQAFDVVLRENPSCHFFSVGRSFFRHDFGNQLLDGGLVAWNGFYQSLRPSVQGLVLNVDLSTTAFYESIFVLEFLMKKLKSFDRERRLSDSDRVRVKKALLKLKIEVTHRSTPRKYRISGLSPGPTKDLTFPLEDGKEMRVVDYFKATYNYVIRYQEIPCLQVQGRKVSYLPMEVCKICEGQKFGGRLTENQTTSILRLACLKPFERERTINSIMARADGPGRGNFSSEFGLDVATEMTTLPARILPAPRLRYGEFGSVKEILPERGAWNLLHSCVVKGGFVEHWTVISFDSRMRKNDVNMFINSLSNRCMELGLQIKPTTALQPFLCGRNDLESPRLERILRDLYNQATRVIKQENPNAYLQLLICIMGEKHPQYGELKRICDTEVGLLTQCCLSKHVSQCKSQYLANLALKINAKVGGTNVALATDLSRSFPTLLNKPTMIFGADVTHPRPTDDSSPSIAAVVANVDWPSANVYIARVRAQKAREEIIIFLKDMVKELWLEFCDKVSDRPERLLFFRDGVSEGQFDHVLQHEVVALKQALREVGGDTYNPLITWVVVQKRHHTRLFPTDQNRDRSNNILPGTVVDTVITHPREFDFYLCSHAGLQGTSRPTHYHILFDENQFGSDDMQKLVYNLCYTYARCTRAVSIVPPAYYAHLAAFRARLYLDSGESGSDTTSLRSGRPGIQESIASASSSRSGPTNIRSLPRIQPVVQQGMYYC